MIYQSDAAHGGQPERRCICIHYTKRAGSVQSLPHPENPRSVWARVVFPASLHPIHPHTPTLYFCLHFATLSRITSYFPFLLLVILKLIRSLSLSLSLTRVHYGLIICTKISPENGFLSLRPVLPTNPWGSLRKPYYLNPKPMKRIRMDDPQRGEGYKLVLQERGRASQRWCAAHREGADAGM